MASIDVTVVTPLSKELPLEVKPLPNGEGDLIEYHPTLPGKYSFNVIYGGEAIPGKFISKLISMQILTACLLQVHRTFLLWKKTDLPKLTVKV